MIFSPARTFAHVTRRTHAPSAALDPRDTADHGLRLDRLAAARAERDEWMREPLIAPDPAPRIVIGRLDDRTGAERIDPDSRDRAFASALAAMCVRPDNRELSESVFRRGVHALQSRADCETVKCCTVEFLAATETVAFSHAYDTTSGASGAKIAMATLPRTVWSWWHVSQSCAQDHQRVRVEASRLVKSVFDHFLPGVAKALTNGFASHPRQAGGSPTQGGSIHLAVQPCGVTFETRDWNSRTVFSVDGIAASIHAEAFRI